MRDNQLMLALKMKTCVQKVTMLPSVEEYKGPHPEKIAAANTEHAHQVALFCWAAIMFNRYPELRLMHAIPNGGERNVIVASNLKAEGAREGVLDIFLPVARGTWHGLYIEMKRPKTEKHPAGRLSDSQKEFISAVRTQGYGAVVCYTWIEARDAVIQYLGWR